MNAKQLVSKINREYAKENGATMTDNGYRLRVTSECTARGPEYFEAAGSYFYQVQGKPEYAASLIYFYAPDVKFAQVDRVRFNDRPWPKTSWATQIYKIVTSD